MTKSYEYLIGQKIQSIQKTHDYLQVFFVSGALLNIFNLHSIVEAIDPNLSGYEILHVDQGEKSIILLLLPEGRIEIGMENSDYRGPEAMMLTTDGHPTVVWP